MLETPEHPSATQGGENAAVGSISRKDVSAAWLAGAFEGEGCVYAYFKPQTNPKARSRMTLTVGGTIYNTHPMFIRRVTEVLVEHGIGFSYSLAERKNGARTGAAVNVQGKGRTALFYRTMMPYLASKKRQAELALELIEYREGLVARAQGRKGMFVNMPLVGDAEIKRICEQISREKHDFPSVLKFSRLPNIILGESSTTLRSPSAA